MVDSGKREEIQQSLIAKAQALIDDCESMPLVLEDASQERRVYMEWKGDQPFMVHFLGVDGVMPTDYVSWFGNYLPNLRAIAPSNVEYTEVQPDGGKFCFHMKLKPGVPLVYNRSLINTAYQTQVDDTHYFITSSEGNESLVETYADQIGSDVIASLTINAIIMKPKLDSCGELCGTELIQVYSMNPNGSLPSMVTDKLMAK